MLPAERPVLHVSLRWGGEAHFTQSEMHAGTRDRLKKQTY